MKTGFVKVLLSMVVLMLIASLAEAGVTAYAFGDYYYLSNHNPAYDGQHGFWLRRVYLTYDRDISDKFKARIRLEMNSDGKFSAADTMKPFIKDAYVSYQFVPLHSFTLGIQESLAFGNTEKFWGYRHVEKTPLDLFKVRDSRDFGLAMKGSFDTGKTFSYAVMYGNNSSYRWEINKQKGIYGRLTYTPTPNWMFEVYADTLGVSNIVDKTGASIAKNTMLLQGFAGYQSDSGRLGLNYMYEDITETGKTDIKTNIYSILGAIKVAKTVEAFARYDMIPDPTPWAQDSYIPMEKGYKTDVLIAGIGWNIHPKVQIAPNVKLVHYGNNAAGVKPSTLKDDACYSVTFYYQF